VSTKIEAIPDKRGRDYSEVIRVGQVIFLAGQCALDDDDQVVGVGDFEAQVRDTFRRIGEMLAHFGASWSDVVETTKIFKEMSPENLAIYQKLRREVMGPRYPVTIGIQSDLMYPELLFEMKVIAVVPD
jgi:enamine deaminase RidA (YjgF/YER057c/UK114 family)